MLIVAHTHFHEQEIHGWVRAVAACACAGARGGTLVGFHGCQCGFGLQSWRRMDFNFGNYFFFNFLIKNMPRH